MKPQKPIFPFTVFVLLVFGLVFFASLLAGCKKDKPLEYPPPPPNVLIETPTRPAQAAGAAIGKYVPWQLRTMPVRIIVVTPDVLFKTRAMDKFDRRPEGISGITAYCQLPDNRPEGNDGWTRIYLSNKLSEEEAARTAGHEWGHIVYWRLLDDDTRWEWMSAWADADKRRVLPSQYARVSAMEGFAEVSLRWFEGGLKLSDPALDRYFSAMLARLSAGRMLQPPV